MTPAHSKIQAQQVLDATRMRQVIDRMARELADLDLGHGDPMLVGIRTRGVPLAEELSSRINAEESIGTLDITLYRDDLSTIARQPVVRATELPGNLDGRTVVLCDDVLFTGRTIRAALDALMDFGRPKTVRLAVLIDRGGRELPIQADVVGDHVEATTGQLVDVRFTATDPAPEGVFVRDRSALEEE